MLQKVKHELCTKKNSKIRAIILFCVELGLVLASLVQFLVGGELHTVPISGSA